jgi:hypothetical protein
MKRIGFIDLDTSHPKSFVKVIERIEGFKVTAMVFMPWNR